MEPSYKKSEICSALARAPQRNNKQDVCIFMCAKCICVCVYQRETNGQTETDQQRETKTVTERTAKVGESKIQKGRKAEDLRRILQLKSQGEEAGCRLHSHFVGRGSIFGFIQAFN